MAEYIKRVSSQIIAFFDGLTPARKASVGIVGAGIVAGITALLFWANEKHYVPIATNLNPDESANIVRVLRDKRVPFTMDAGGKSISIPSENVQEFRLELASAGLPQTLTNGYEIFDKQTFGVTSAVHKINQKRALEGELMRTIGGIKGVRRSRVHLAIPQKSAFVEDQKKASASVALDLDPGVTLHEKQIFGVQNLVARAVEGLDIESVMIVDSNGKMLSKNTSDPLSAMNLTQLEFKSKYETEMERRVEEMLSKVVGDGRVMAKVSAEMDFQQVSEVQTVYDADGSAVRSTEKQMVSANGSRPAPRGPAGAAANQPLQADANPAIRSDSSNNKETTNFAVPQTIRNVTKPNWAPKRLSVAVVVDGKPVKEEKDGVITAKTEPWSPEKIKEFEGLIARAVGLDPKRGDALEVKNMEFARQDFEEAQRLLEETDRKEYVRNMLIYGVIGLAILLFFLMVVRPFVKWMTENTIDSVDTFLPQTIEELERLQKNNVLPGMEEIIPELPEKMDPEKVEGEMLKEKIITMVDGNPHKAALILRDWLHGEAKAPPASDKSASA